MGDPLTWNGHSGFYAYQFGYLADAGNLPRIILDFGWQLWENGIWKNVLVPNGAHVSTNCTNCWVHLVAQDFIQGYNDNSKSHGRAYIGIGTNNGNYPWACTGTSDWYNAGQAWNILINSLNPPSRVNIRAANDIESWYGTKGFGTWVACGASAESWYDGYESLSPTFPNYNYGSNAHVEYPSLWSVQQVFDVSYGRSTAWSYPQIYCLGQPQSWASIRQYGYMHFLGVTSDNAQSFACNNKTVRSYTWQTAWSTFDSVLANAGFANNVDNAALSFR